MIKLYHLRFYFRHCEARRAVAIQLAAAKPRSSVDGLMNACRGVALGVLWLVLSLTACSSDKEKKAERLCPQTAIIRELEHVMDYGVETPDSKTLVATALMKKVTGRCEYTDTGVDVGFELIVAAGKGPRLGGDKVNFPFFVSILTPEQKIVAKEQMTAEFSFSGSSKVTEQIEQLHVFIPMDKDADGTNYQVLMGFQLSEDQLKNARAREDSFEVKQ